MMNKLEYEINSKENLYFSIKVVFALIGYGAIYTIFSRLGSIGIPMVYAPIIIYIVLILLILLLRIGLLIGYIKGNTIRVTQYQFPNLHSVLIEQCSALGIEKIPNMYVMQSGGILNAFATSFMGSNYIVLYSEIVEEVYNENVEAVEFVIGHELGHIKRKHVLKSLLLFPSILVPFLNSAYSRACEYTCDNIGAALSPKGIKPGLLLLAAGKNIWKKVDIERFTDQEITEDGFWFWFSEKVSSHPRLTKRVLRFNYLSNPKTKPTLVEMTNIEVDINDHTKYLPKY